MPYVEQEGEENPSTFKQYTYYESTTDTGEMTDGSAALGLFGDLIDEVALVAPISRARLVEALARVDTHGPPERAPDTVHDDVAVYDLTVAEWATIAGESELTPTAELAVREVHRRFAATVGVTPATADTDPFVHWTGTDSPCRFLSG
jgi:hypothetical protein